MNNSQLPKPWHPMAVEHPEWYDNFHTFMTLPPPPTQRRQTTTPPQPMRHSAPIRTLFSREIKATHEITRHFAPLCAYAAYTSPPDQDAAGGLRQPPGYRDAVSIFLPNLTKSLTNSPANSRTSVPACQPIQPPQKSFYCESHFKPTLFGRIKQLNRGRLACPYAIRNTQYAIRNSEKNRFPMWTHIRCVCPAHSPRCALYPCLLCYNARKPFGSGSRPVVSPPQRITALLPKGVICAHP